MTNKVNKFFLNLNSNLLVNTDYEKKEYDYSWIDKFEECIYHIDNILRNPKRFIVNEEEIVKVELSKKVTVESIIHLTQHTNLIQEIKDDEVKPSKILNINKDETLDTYENRFIYTLILNMRDFYDLRVKGDYESYYCDKKKIKYEGNTLIGTEKVNISLSLDSFDKKSLAGELNITERMEKIKVQIDGFLSGELVQSLNKLHVPIVRSPIKKTNVILKNPNFQKAVELWNFIQSYEEKAGEVIKENKNYTDIGELKDQYDHSFLLSYLNNEALAQGKHTTEKKAISYAINRLIENIFDNTETIDNQTIKKIFNKTLVETNKKTNARNNNIRDLLYGKLKKYNDEISNLIKMIEV